MPVHLTLLSRRAGLFTTRRLAQAARQAGHRVRTLDPQALELELGPEGPALRRRGALLSLRGACIPRLGAASGHALAVLDHLQLLGVPSLNPAQALLLARNPLRMLQRLSGAGVPVPRSVMAADAEALRALADRVGGPPLLIRLLSPEGRPGVLLCESAQSMEAALEAVLSRGHQLLVQRYVRRRRERDLRALVAGSEVVAWVERRPKPGKLLLALARGARLSPVSPGPALGALAVKAASVLGLGYAAVDLLEGPDGPSVFDVQGSPGLQRLEAATGRDLASPVVAAAVALAKV
jgi:ribosomal protein S6--L-glutamate ligase